MRGQRRACLRVSGTPCVPGRYQEAMEDLDFALVHCPASGAEVIGCCCGVLLRCVPEDNQEMKRRMCRVCGARQ